MEPALYDLNIAKNALFERQFLWQPNSENYDETAGWTAEFKIKQNGGSRVYLDLNTSGSGLAIQGPHFTVALSLLSAVTAAFNFSYANYFLTIIDSNGERYPLLRGNVTVERES